MARKRKGRKSSESSKRVFKKCKVVEPAEPEPEPEPQPGSSSSNSVNHGGPDLLDAPMTLRSGLALGSSQPTPPPPPPQPPTRPNNVLRGGLALQSVVIPVPHLPPPPTTTTTQNNNNHRHGPHPHLGNLGQLGLQCKVRLSILPPNLVPTPSSSLPADKRIVSCLGDQPMQAALHNPLIMSTVAKYLPTPDLVKLRRIARSWNQAFAFQLRTRLKPVHFEDLKRFKVFVGVMSKSSISPFTKFLIRNIPFSLKCVLDLFTYCGPTMTHLAIHLEGKTDFTAEHLKEILFEYTPMLRELEINDHRLLSQSIWNSGPLRERPEQAHLTLPKLRKVNFKTNSTHSRGSQDFLADLFSAALNLEEIKVHHLFSHFEADFNYNLTLLQAIQQGAHLQRLQSLKIRNISMTEFEFLIQLSEQQQQQPPPPPPQQQQLQLQRKGGSGDRLRLAKFDASHIRVGVLREEKGKRLLGKFLACHALTLRHLKAKLHRHFVHKDHLKIAIPYLPNLEILDISVNLNFMTKCSSLAINFPALKKLCYQNDGVFMVDQDMEFAPGVRHDVDTIMDFSGPPHLGITHVEFGGVEVLNDLIDLKRLCPAIISLHIKLNRMELLPHLWTIWPNLQVLHLSFGFECEMDILEECITGIPLEHHATLIEMLQELEPGNPITRELLAELKTLPGITDLAGLREFDLNIVGSYCGGPYYVTDISGYFGFAVPGTALRFLQLSGRHGISRKCQDVIKQVLGPHAKIELNRYNTGRLSDLPL